jgi:hypothetical protein
VFIVHEEKLDEYNEPEPKNIREAVELRFWPEWLKAIHQELTSLEAMNVYQEVDKLPPGRKAVGSKWVLILKRDENGKISRFKARLVAQGFTQIPGQDFTHTFAPVARWDLIRLLLSVATTHDWELRHIDIKTANLNGILKEEIYLKHPKILGPGYWLLKKALYGLRQSGREWYLEMDKMYCRIGMVRCESDWSVHRQHQDDNISMTATSVDDISLVSNSIAKADRFTQQISAKYGSQATVMQAGYWAAGLLGGDPKDL